MIRVLSSLALAAGLAFSGASAFAATPQQQKMSVCSKDAAGLAKAERDAFMKACLAKDSSPTQLTQQQRMKSCNAEAGTKALKGAERQAFMKTCLSSDAPPGAAAAATTPAAPAATPAASAPVAAVAAGAKPTQQQKMKSCNTEAGAKALKGDARQTFMKQCLSA